MSGQLNFVKPTAEMEAAACAFAQCFYCEGETTINASLMILDDEVGPGDFLIIHAGFAIRKLDRKEAQDAAEKYKLISHLSQMIGALPPAAAVPATQAMIAEMSKS